MRECKSCERHGTNQECKIYGRITFSVNHEDCEYYLERGEKDE